MSSGRDEVQKGMDSIVPETGITFDTWLFRQDIIILAFKMTNDLLETVKTLSLTKRSDKDGGNIRKFIVNVVTKARGIDNGQGNANAIFFQLCRLKVEINKISGNPVINEDKGSPTLTGLILMPSSTCAVSGSSEILWAKTSDSQRVLTKVVRPVPEAPSVIESAI